MVVGCLEETLDTLAHLYHLGGSVDAIVTLPGEQAEKAGVTNWVDLEPFAEAHHIPLHRVELYSMKSRADAELMRSLNAEVALVVGWQRLIPPDLIDLAALGFIGFHGSANFLPWGRGRSPINWSIIEGRDRFILHMFFITPGVDSGDVIGFEVYDICREDTCRSVYYKTAMAQATLIHRFLPKILEGNCPRYPQVGEEFYYPKRTAEDGRIDWNLPGEDVCRLVRAVTRPYPGAFGLLAGERVRIWRCQYFGENLLTEHLRPGEVAFVSSNMWAEVVVRCGRGAVLIDDYESPVTIRRGDVFDV